MLSHFKVTLHVYDLRCSDRWGGCQVSDHIKINKLKGQHVLGLQKHTLPTFILAMCCLNINNNNNNIIIGYCMFHYNDTHYLKTLRAKRCTSELFIHSTIAESGRQMSDL